MPHKCELTRPDWELIAGYSAMNDYSSMRNIKLIKIYTRTAE